VIPTSGSKPSEEAERSSGDEAPPAEETEHADDVHHHESVNEEVIEKEGGWSSKMSHPLQLNISGPILKLLWLREPKLHWPIQLQCNPLGRECMNQTLITMLLPSFLEWI
jgi:hypothetical protein